MFNLGTLLQVSALTMGVASATPIRNAEENHVLTTKNQTQVKDYELSFTQVNETTSTYNDFYIYSFIDYEKKTNYQIQTSYLNVLATKYETQAQVTINSHDCLGYQNNYNTYYYSKISRVTWVMQITPYNYNLDTESTLRFSIDLSTYTTESNGDQTILLDTYLNRNVYTTYINDWSQYLNRQMVALNAYNVLTDIENVNNNFYYTKEENKRAIPSNTPQQPTIKDVTELTLTPKTTNYVVIDYVISVDTLFMDFQTEETEVITNDMVYIETSYLNFDTPTISGTNIIPDGNYEVIDIPGLMWEILTMPFAFISQAFNLTLFPGTPYQVNISNLFLSIIAVITFVWLITFFLKLKG